MDHDTMAAEDHEDNFAPTHHHIEETDKGVTSLKALAGQRFVNEARFFFEELQTGLPSINASNIVTDEPDELWCILDWYRYILAVWTVQFSRTSDATETRWMDIKEAWERILGAVVLLNLKYACPPKEHERLAFQSSEESLSFKRSIYHGRDELLGLPAEDRDLADAVIARSSDIAQDTPILHARAFRELIDGVMDYLEGTPSSSDIRPDSCSGLESVEFIKFIQILSQEIGLLFRLSSARAQHEDTFAIALKAALSEHQYGQSIRYLQFYQSVLSVWSFDEPVLQVELDRLYHERVQEVFGDTIALTEFSRNRSSPRYTVDDLHQIIALGADIRGKINGRMDCALCMAAEANLPMSLVKALMHAGAPYSINLNEESYPLQAAASFGNTEMVAFLLNRKQHNYEVDVNHIDVYRKTALHHAADGSSQAIVKSLLQQPQITTDCIDPQGQTPFLRAISAATVNSRRYATIKEFVRNRMVDCDQSTTYASNALHLAAPLKDATLKILIGYVKGISSRNHAGSTPLHEAASKNSRPNVELLLKHGADPTIEDDFGYTPLLLACKEHHLGSMKLLLGLPNAISAQCPAPVKLESYMPPSEDH